MADNSAVGVRFRQEQVVRDVLAELLRGPDSDEYGSFRSYISRDRQEDVAGRVVDALAAGGNLI